MTLKDYFERRRQIQEAAPRFRRLCTTCLQPEFGCYCSHVQKFDSKIEFAILIHPIEVKRRIATGRMSHLCLENSHLIMGQDYSENKIVNKLIADPNNQCLILYPGVKSVNLSHLAEEHRQDIFEPHKKLIIFVIDGTWATAKKMLSQSKNLKSLQRVCFSLNRTSNFRVRKQPAPECFSTIEAIHEVIELAGNYKGFRKETREHDKLLSVFDKMVERQLDFIRRAEEDPSRCNYRKVQKRSSAAP